MERICQKLVRDKIPQIIAAKGETPITRQLNAVDYQKALENKLLEECNEVLAATGQDRIEELSDVLAVVKALGELEGVDLHTIQTIAAQKADRNGAFEKRIFLEKIIH